MKPATTFTRSAYRFTGRRSPQLISYLI